MVRKQDILAKELTKGCAGRMLFARHWRAQLRTSLPSSGPPCQACLAVPTQPIEPDEVVSKPNGGLTTALFPLQLPRTLGTTNRSDDADKRDEPGLAHAPDHPLQGTFPPGTRRDHPRGLIAVICTQAARLRRIGNGRGLDVCDLTAAVWSVDHPI